MAKSKIDRWLDYIDAQKKIKNKKLPKSPKKKKVKTAKKKWVNYHKYIRSAAWKRKREKALMHHGNYCRVCNTTYGLQVHHLTYKNLGREKMEDLTVLCGEHHKEYHDEQNR